MANRDRQPYRGGDGGKSRNQKLMEDYIHQFESNIDDLKAELEQKELINSGKERKIEMLSGENSKEVGLVNQLLCDQITLQNTRDKLYSDKLDLTLEMEEMAQFINTTSLEKEELAGKNHILTESNVTLEEKHNNLKNQLNALEKVNSEELERMSEEINSKKESIHFLTLELETVKQKCVELECETGCMSEKLIQSTEECEDLIGQLTTASIEVAQLKGEMQELTRERDSLDENLHEEQTKCGKISQELSGRNEDVVRLEAFQTNQAKELAAQAEEIETLRQDCTALHNELSQCSNEKEQLKKGREELTNECQRLENIRASSSVDSEGTMANRDHGSSQPYRGGGNHGRGRSDRYFGDSYHLDSDRRRASYHGYGGYGDEYYVERRDYYDDSRYSNPQSRGRGKGNKNKRKKNRPNSSQSDREIELDGNDSDNSTQSEPPFDKREILYSNKPFLESKIESNRDSKMKETGKEERNPSIENRSTKPVSGVNSNNIPNTQADLQKDGQLYKSKSGATKIPDKVNPNALPKDFKPPTKDTSKESATQKSEISPVPKSLPPNPSNVNIGTKPAKKSYSLYTPPDKVESAESTKSANSGTETPGNVTNIPLPPPSLASAGTPQKINSVDKPAQRGDLNTSKPVAGTYTQQQQEVNKVNKPNKIVATNQTNSQHPTTDQQNPVLTREHKPAKVQISNPNTPPRPTLPPSIPLNFLPPAPSDTSKPIRGDKGDLNPGKPVDSKTPQQVPTPTLEPSIPLNLLPPAPSDTSKPIRGNKGYLNPGKPVDSKTPQQLPTPTLKPSIPLTLLPPAPSDTSKPIRGNKGYLNPGKPVDSKTPQQLPTPTLEPSIPLTLLPPAPSDTSKPIRGNKGYLNPDKPVDSNTPQQVPTPTLKPSIPLTLLPPAPSDTSKPIRGNKGDLNPDKPVDSNTPQQVPTPTLKPSIPLTLLPPAPSDTSKPIRGNKGDLNPDKPVDSNTPQQVPTPTLKPSIPLNFLPPAPIDTSKPIRGNKGYLNPGKPVDSKTPQQLPTPTLKPSTPLNFLPPAPSDTSKPIRGNKGYLNPDKPVDSNTPQQVPTPTLKPSIPLTLLPPAPSDTSKPIRGNKGDLNPGKPVDSKNPQQLPTPTLEPSIPLTLAMSAHSDVSSNTGNPPRGYSDTSLYVTTQQAQLSNQVAEPNKALIVSKEMDFLRKIIEDQNLRIAKLETELGMKENEMSVMKSENQTKVETLCKSRDEQFAIHKRELTTLRESNLNLEFRLDENLHQKQILKDDIVEKEKKITEVTNKLTDENSELSHKFSTEQNEHRLAAETANRLNESLEQEKVIVGQLQGNLLTLQNERDDLHKNNLALTMSMEDMVDCIKQDELAEKNRILTETNASLEEEQKNLKGQLNEMAEFQDQSSVCSVFASNASNVNMSGDMDGKALDHIITLQNRIWSLQEVIRAMKD